MSLVNKPKTQKGRRFLAKREGKLEENTKRVMLIRGGKTSETVTQALKDIFVLKKPNASMMHKKNILRPFEDQTSLEFFSQKNDCSLMVFGSHSKKRPNNLVLGSFYDNHVLDMFELKVEKFKAISEFKASKVMSGTKPCILVSGEEFQSKTEYSRLKNILVDFWRGEKVTNLNLQGVEHIVQITAADGRVYIRSYRALLKKSGLRTPRVELEEIGPSLDLVLNRSHLAEETLYKESLKQPKVLKAKPKKNIDRDVFGTKTGRIHMQKQDLGNMQTRKMKGLKRKAPAAKADGANNNKGGRGGGGRAGKQRKTGN